MRIKLSILVILCGWIFSCFRQPAIWVDDRPNDPKYWHGVGFASNAESNNPKILAKEYAIREISTQIKINISSDLDIITSDINGTIDNVITSVMNSRVNLMLPELEFVDSYNTDNGVYFYARLNKNNYYKTMERLRANAKEISLDYVSQADKKFGKESLVFIQSAWQEIFPFNDEPIEVKYDNQKFNLFSLIRQKHEEYVKRISIKANFKKEKIRTIIDRDNILTVKVFDKLTGRKLEDIPIKINQSNKTSTYFSDKKGHIELDIGNRVEKSMLDILFSLDYTKLFENKEKQKNILITSNNLGSIHINVVPSKVQIKSKEKNLNKLMQNPIIEPVIKEMLNGHVEFVNIKPDFYLHIESNTLVKAKKVEPGFPFFSYGSATIRFIDAENNQEFFVANVTDIKGGDFGSQRIAGIRAYDQMKSAIVKELEKKLFNL